MSKTPAPDDAKKGISNQLVTIEFDRSGHVVEKFGRPGEMGIAAVYVAANVIKNDVTKRYEPWTGTWTPIALGGWFSSEYILERIERILNIIAEQGFKPVAADTRVSKMIPPAMHCNAECMRKGAKDKCELLAQELFGKTAAMLPGAGDFACNYGKTGLYFTIGLVGVTLMVGVAFILRPYASIVSTAIQKKRLR